jgi:protein-S-isoprenylcysteine O-methyltransferase Ste14
MNTIALTKNAAYDRTMRLLGSMWFMFLALIVAIRLGKSLDEPWPSLLSSFSIAVFYMLLAWLIFTRAPAKAHAEGIWPRVAAFVGTYMPWLISIFGKSEQALPNLASTVCVLTGMAMVLVTIRHLGRSFSIVPQAHSVVQTGPYRWIRHPLYLAEEIAVLGVVLQYLTPVTVLIFVAHIGVQIARILYEENLLRRNFPEYASYEANRWRLIPFLW